MDALPPVVPLAPPLMATAGPSTAPVPQEEAPQQQQTVALFVGGLNAEISEVSLQEAFSTGDDVAVSVKICRDTITGLSLGHGYVNFKTREEGNPDDLGKPASRAIEKMNNSQLYGNKIRVTFSNRDPDARKSNAGNIFVKNLVESVDDVKLHEIFSQYGTILSHRVATTSEGKSKGHGFIQFDSQASADSAIEQLNGSNLDGKEIYVGRFMKKSERMIPNSEVLYTNLYIKNLDEDITEELLRLKFSEFGKITNLAISKDSKGNHKGFAFVNFEHPSEARRAVDTMNGVQLGSKSLYVARAQKKAERQQMLRQIYEEKRNEQFRTTMGSNLYVKNIQESVDDNELKQHFSAYGNITSAKVMRNEKGISRGFGFVCFSTRDEANEAVKALHGNMFHGKPLFISIAQRKQERKMQLQMYYSQSQFMTGLATPMGAVIPPAYPCYYSPTPSVVPNMPQRQGLVYPHYGMGAGWRPNGFYRPARLPFQPTPTMPNALRQNRQNRGPVNRHVPSPDGHAVPYLPYTTQQPNFGNRSKDFNNLQGGANEQTNGTSSMQKINILRSTLASVSPQQQKQILGEHLFPLVEQHEADLAAKITGMLLEMDNTELLLLIESPQLFAAKVEEALHVLRISKAKVGGTQETVSSNFLSAEVAVK